MAQQRNIFLEAALKGKPVVENPADVELYKGKDQEKHEKAAAEKRKPNKEMEMTVIKEAIQHVGRLPSKVLRYVELMANKLGPLEEKYYSSVGKMGGPSRETARKRICRKINQITGKHFSTSTFSSSVQNTTKNVGASTSYTKLTKASPADAEELYQSWDEADKFGDPDERYLFKPNVHQASQGSQVVDIEEWMKNVNAEEDGDDVFFNELEEKRTKKKKGTKSTKKNIDAILEKLPDLMDTVTNAAKAHKKAIEKWQNLDESSDSN